MRPVQPAISFAQEIVRPGRGGGEVGVGGQQAHLADGGLGVLTAEAPADYPFDRC
jgi:hypothetical protein